MKRPIAGFETAYAAGLSRKLGLFQPRPDDLSLAQDLFERMARNGADFTLIFRRLCDAAASPDGDAGVRTLFTDPSSFDDWAARWRTCSRSVPTCWISNRAAWTSGKSCTGGC